MRIVLFILALLVSPTYGWAEEFMQTGKESHDTFALDELCQSKPHVCTEDGKGQQRLVLTNQHWQFLTEFNQWVDRLMVPTSDQEKHGVLERWELLNCLKQPGGDCRGDCEEYVLLKRQFLIENGWPASALLMTVVKDQKKEGHLVLTILTSVGDFILDNKTTEVLRWDKVPYKFEARQSTANPKVWLVIKPRKAKSPSVAVSSWSKGTKVHPVR